MAINPNDDYEQLAKLIYPSFEASGNVYYGQTRKLTLDEVLKKNDLGFESYTSSDSFNNKYFCWKLGPLHDSFETSFDYTFGVHVMAKDVSTHAITVDAFNTVCQIIDDQDGNLSYDSLQIDQKLYGTFWAKYIIHTNNKTVDNILGSGDYKTYEKDISIELSNIVCTYYVSPVDGTFVNDRNFIVDNNTSCIYIKICNSTDSADDEYIEPEYTAEQLIEPVTISVKSGSVDISLLRINTNNELYYKKNNEELLLIPKQEFRSVSLVSGDKLYLSGKHYGTSSNNGDFNISTENASNDCEIELYGNINALLDKDNPSGVLNVPAYAFARLFNQFNTDFDSSSLILPAKLLNEGCYSMMFANSSMTKAPENLPAEDIPSYCYKGMFSSCDKLTTVPKLPHLNSLQYESLASMFGGCTSLVKAYDKIEFTSSSISIDSFSGMFSACTSIESAPKLPNEPIGARIYEGMFTNCTSLKSAPKLSTISNTNSITPYMYMFNGCTSLQFVACNADSTFDINGGINWLNNVSSTGVFYKNDNNNSWTSGPAGIPEGWTIKNWYELPADPVNGFNIQYLPNPEYTNKVLLTSGVDSYDNGRGVLSTGTVYNMSTLFDEDNEHQINTCNKSSGSYNQDVWGYKTFNSPVKFRNGIYGETASLIATTVDNKNVTKLSLYDSTLYGVFPYNDDFINKPHIQLGYEVRADDQEYDSVIEFKANKIVIDGKLETANSNGLIPYIPTELSPDDSINDDVEIGELCQLLVRGVPSSTSSDVKWSESNSNWVYQGFVKQSSASNYFIYYNSNNDSQCQYARYSVNAAADADNVEYAAGYDDTYWQSWESVWNNDSTNYDGTSVRFGIWENYGEYTDVNGNMATVYKNDWVKFDDSFGRYTTLYYWVFDDSGIPSGISTDCINNETSANEAAVQLQQDYPYNMFLQENNNWVLEASPSSSNDMIYYNSNNTDCKIYNATTDYYYYDYNEDITSTDYGHNIEYGEEEYSASNQNWKPFGIFYNSTNTNSNNKYFRNYNYDGTYTYMSNGNSSYYGSAADPTMLNHSFTSVMTIPEYYVHYGTVLYKSNNSWYLNDDDHEVEVYLVTITPSLTDASLHYSVSTLNTQSSSARFVTLSSALTSTDSSTVPSGNTGYIFYAQRLQNQYD